MCALSRTLATVVGGAVTASVISLAGAGTASADSPEYSPGPDCLSAVSKYYTAIAAGAAVGGLTWALAGGVTSYQSMIEACGTPPPDSYNTT